MPHFPPFFCPFFRLPAPRQPHPPLGDLRCFNILAKYCEIFPSSHAEIVKKLIPFDGTNTLIRPAPAGAVTPSRALHAPDDGRDVSVVKTKIRFSPALDPLAFSTKKKEDKKAFRWRALNLFATLIILLLLEVRTPQVSGKLIQILLQIPGSPRPLPPPPQSLFNVLEFPFFRFVFSFSHSFLTLQYMLRVG